MNYTEWALSVKLAINSRGKMGSLTGETPKPKIGDTDKNKWQIENTLWNQPLKSLIYFTQLLKISLFKSRK